MEEWRDCFGYEDCYEISDHGNVRSKDRQSISYGTRLCNRKGKELKTHIGKNGYVYVELCREGKRKTFNIHRLVGLTFLANPFDLPMIDHMDRDKTNNHISNLRWVSGAENQHNKGVHKNNASGEQYIQVMYRVSIIRDGKKIQKVFKTMDEAKEFRKTIVGY